MRAGDARGPREATPAVGLAQCVFRCVGGALGAAASEGDLRGLLVECARVVGADGAMLDLDGRVLVVGVDGGSTDPRESLGNGGPLGRPSAVEVVDSVACDPRCAGMLAAELLEHVGVRSVLSVPLADGGDAGLLRFVAARERAFGAAEVAAGVLLGQAVVAGRRSACESSEAARAAAELNEIVDGTREAVVVAGADGRIRWLSLAARALLGVPREKALGLPLRGFFDDSAGDSPSGGAVDLASKAAADAEPDARPDHAAVAAHDLLACRGEVRECRARRVSGEVFSAAIVVRMLSASAGGGSFVQFRDLTAAKSAEARTREADRLAVMGTLAAGLGHDMNNMLFPIQAHLNALAKPKLRRHADREPHVAGIRSGIAYLQRLADSLHALALDPDGDGGDAGGATELEEWWQQVGPLLVKSLHRRAEVEVRFDPGLAPVTVPGHSLTRALLNLLVNASEAMPTGRPRELCRVLVCGSAAPAGNRVVLEVVDNGVGMTPEVRRRALDMFFTTKIRGVGTGMGLPLVRRVVERAGGSVEIASREGAGTTVRLLLPAADAGEQRSAPPRVLVSLSDGRLRALVRALLERHEIETHEIETHESGNGLDFDAWIAGSDLIAVEQASEWCRTHPAERLVVIARTPASARRFAPIGVAVVRDKNDLHAIGRALDRAAVSGEPAATTSKEQCA